MRAGKFRITLDFEKLGVSSGIYFYKIVINNSSKGSYFVSTKKMIFSK